MDRNAVTPFGITYRNGMTGEFGFLKHDSYNLWGDFKAQLYDKFSIMHQSQRALRDMEKVWYEGDIEKYQLTLENLNIDAKMTVVAWRHMIGKMTANRGMETKGSREIPFGFPMCRNSPKLHHGWRVIQRTTGPGEIYGTTGRTEMGEVRAK